MRSVAAVASSSPGTGRPAGLLVLASSYVSQQKIDETIAAASSPYPIGVVTLKSLLSLAEMAGAGRVIHEIGTRGRVLADHGEVIVLHLDGSDAEVVTCPASHVARAAERVVRTPVPRAAMPRLRPSLG